MLRTPLGLLVLVSCATPPAAGDPSDYAPVDWTSSDGKADTGIAATFDRNSVMSDRLFTAAAAVTGDGVQQFLEQTPYGRSWLADATLDGMRFADDLVLIAQRRGLDPVLLLARMQVESSLVSASVRPSAARLDAALGCGCPDSPGCAPEFAGLANQLRCASDVLANQFAGSQTGNGNWNLGVTRTSGDGLHVTPHTNATAALYSYTPWVLVGTGGNWLVWNVTRRYLKAFDAAGNLTLP